MAGGLYEQDFIGWTEQQARPLRGPSGAGAPMNRAGRAQAGVIAGIQPRSVRCRAS